jgi:hypothetical protein
MVMNKNDYPSSPNPNQLKPKSRVRAVAAATTLAIASFGAGFVAGSTAEGGASAKSILSQPGTTVPRPTPEQRANAPINREIIRANHNMAASILNFAKRHKDDSRVQITTRSEGDISPRLAGVKKDVTIVTVNTGSLLDNGDGQYVFSLTGKRAEDGLVSPDSVNDLNISVSSGDFQSDMGDSISSEQLYNYESFPVGDGRRLVVRVETKGVNSDAQYFSTESQISEPLQPLGLSDLDYRTQQANTVIDWAESFAPVNYVPGK